MPTIVFDLGGVLVENVTLSALGALLSGPNDVETVRDRWLKSGSVRAFELGRITADEFAACFLAEWDLFLSPAEFLAEFDTWPRAFWPDSLELVDELRAKHQVACLSNCNERHWRRFDGFVGQFDAAFSSHLLGRIKPDRDAFEMLLDRLAVQPRETYYFDDSPACVATALDLGIRAHLVDGPRTCRRILAAEGLCEARDSQATNAGVQRGWRTVQPQPTQLTRRALGEKQAVTSALVRGGLETERTVLRRLTCADAVSLFRSVGDPAVMRHWHPGPDRDVAATARRIADIDTHWQAHGFGDWGVVEKSSGEVIGFAGLHHIADMNEVNIGYVLCRDHWRRGLGREIAMALLDHAFRHVGMAEVAAVVDPCNTASLRLANACGLTLRKRFVWMGQERLAYGIARQEWEVTCGGAPT